MLDDINFKMDKTYKKFDIKIKKNIKNLILHNGLISKAIHIKIFLKKKYKQLCTYKTIKRATFIC